MEILHIWKMTKDTPNIVLSKDKLKGKCKNRKPKRVKVLCSFIFFPNYHYENSLPLSHISSCMLEIKRRLVSLCANFKNIHQIQQIVMQACAPCTYLI